MKKQWISVILTVFVLFNLTACGKTEEKTPGEALLQTMARVNTNEALVQAHGRIASDTTFTFVDGSTDTLHQYADAARYYQRGSFFELMEEAGRGWDYNMETGVLRQQCYAGGSLQELQPARTVSGFAYDPALETVETVEEQDGLLTITTVVTDPDYLVEQTYPYGYGPGSVEKLRLRYEADAGTCELRRVEMIVVLPDEVERLAASAVLVPEPPVWTPDPEREARLQAEPRRIITVTVDARPQAFEVAAGLPVQIVLPERCGGLLYTDVECTAPYLGEDDLQENLVLYATTK